MYNNVRSRLFSVMVVFFVLFSLLPTGYELIRRDRIRPERQFELVHNFPTDFNFYLSRIRQGLTGRWTVVEVYTSEEHQGSLIHEFYLLLGQVGRRVRVPWHRSADVYHVARVVFGGLLLVMITQFCKRSFSEGCSGETFFSRGAVRGSFFAAHPSNPSVSSPSMPPVKDMTVLEKTRRAAPRDFLSVSLMAPASLAAFLLAVTASSWPKLVNWEGSWRFGGYMSWWSVMDSLQRITFIPHLLGGQALIVFLIMALSERESMARPRNWIFLGILAFVLGMVFPPGLVFVIAFVAVVTVLDATVFGDRANFKTAAVTFAPIGRGIVVIVGLPALLYLKLMTSIYPWKRLAEFDILHPLPFDYLEYAKAVGPVLPLGLIGLLIALVKRDRAMRGSVVWVLAWLLLLFVFRFVPQQSPLRFSEMLPHVPLAVLTAYVFASVGAWAGSGSALFGDARRTAARPYRASRSVLSEDSAQKENFGFLGLLRRIFSAPHNAPPRRPYAFDSALRRVFLSVICHLSFVIPTAVIAVGLGQLYSSYLWQRDFIDHKMAGAYPLVPTGTYVMYPLKDFMTAIRFIGDSVPQEAVVLSETTAGNYIPAYSGHRVYVGHANTVRAEQKEALVRRFFGGTMAADQARQLLAENRIAAVFYGPQEKEDGNIADLAKAYPFLTSVYHNANVTIYALR